MHELAPTLEPHPFKQTDLQPGLLAQGVDRALQTFEVWRDNNPNLIAEHIDDLTYAIHTTANAHTLPRRMGRLVLPLLRHRFDAAAEQEFVEYFGLHNLGEVIAPEHVEFLRARIHAARETFSTKAARQDFLGASLGVVKQFAPELQGLPEMDWLEERIRHLRTILPEAVIVQGGLGKVMRTIMGVVTIATYDVADESSKARHSHLRQVIPGAYALGATYALIDDALQSSAGGSIKSASKTKYHHALTHSFATGEDIDISNLPDHPISDELHLLYKELLASYPFQPYRHLYHAIEAMYHAQYRNAHLTPEIAAAQGGRRAMYGDMAIKASMTRVVANILARRAVGDSNYTKFLNSVLGSQLKDDFEDQIPDALENNCTIFTMPYDPEASEPNPLYDIFAFDAYVRHRVWGAHPDAASRLIRFGPSEIGPYLANHKEHGAHILRKFPHTAEIARFVTRATCMTEEQARKVLPLDMALESVMRRNLGQREQTGIDPLTFLTDRLEYINNIVGAAVNSHSLLGEIASYSLDAGGKRLRPGLTLMLAEGLGIPYEHVEPLLQTAELFHTSSLVFDDLPAQDRAALRRGKPTTHIAYTEWGAQLAGISMISRGFGVLTQLTRHFPAKRVSEVVRYADSSLGFEGLCKGQAMDLQDPYGKDTSLADILKMYQLKTSVAMEASLVPLMMLAGRGQQEIDHIKDYAYHAGIVFQIKDDILDMTARTEQIGKDAQNDKGKTNIVRTLGMELAERIMDKHLQAALGSLEHLPFNTDLLKGVVRYFIKRNK